jgi:hypothetical protein
MTMKNLPDLPLETKLLASATLVYAGLSLLMGFGYVLQAHQGTEGYGIHASEIAALYTGPGAGVTTLISLAHIHLLGLLPVFAIVGFVFVFSTLPKIWKIVLPLVPFVAFFIDVASWFLTKFVAYDFVYLVIGGGAIFISTLGLMIVLSLFDIWFGRRNAA